MGAADSVARVDAWLLGYERGERDRKENGPRPDVPKWLLGQWYSPSGYLLTADQDRVTINRLATGEEGMFSYPPSCDRIFNTYMPFNCPTKRCQAKRQLSNEGSLETTTATLFIEMDGDTIGVTLDGINERFHRPK